MARTTDDRKMRLDRVRSVLLGVVAIAGIAASLAAQTVRPSGVTDTVCTYERCSLWLYGGRLVQGAEASVVARSGFFRPLRVLPFVAGDSARHYAALFERNSRRASRLSLAGLTVIAAGFVVGLSGECRTITVFDAEFCQDDASGPIAAGLLLGGYTMEFIALSISSRGHRSLVRALWWHNRQYAR